MGGSAVRHGGHRSAGTRAAARGCRLVPAGRGSDRLPAACGGVARPGPARVHPHQSNGAGRRLRAERVGAVRAVQARPLGAAAADCRRHAVYRRYRHPAAAELPRRRGGRARAGGWAGHDHLALDLLASRAACLRPGLCAGAAPRPGAYCARARAAGSRSRRRAGAGRCWGLGHRRHARIALAAAPGHGRQLFGPDNVGRRPGGAGAHACCAGRGVARHARAANGAGLVDRGVPPVAGARQPAHHGGRRARLRRLVCRADRRHGVRVPHPVGLPARGGRPADQSRGGGGRGGAGRGGAAAGAEDGGHRAPDRRRRA